MATRQVQDWKHDFGEKSAVFFFTYDPDATAPWPDLTLSMFLFAKICGKDAS